jgi:hypothetical protein
MNILAPEERGPSRGKQTENLAFIKNAFSSFD